MIRIDHLSKSYGNKVLLEDVSYHFPEGERIALVGANGAGKTTLLKIITGNTESSSGSILIPARCSLGYLPQEPNPKPEATVLEECLAGAKQVLLLKEEMEVFLQKMTDDPSEENISSYTAAESQFALKDGYSIDSKAHQILAGLGFINGLTEKSPLAMSGGWRMRLELAKLFMAEPDFLILDEPTNHLDLPSLVWVENYLQNFGGTLLFVSHDRSLLNKLSTHTLEVSNRMLQPYKGNFDHYLAQKQLRLEYDQARMTQIEKRKSELQGFVDRFGSKASKAKQAQSRVRMIEKLREQEDTLQTSDRVDSVFIKLPAPKKSGRLMLNMEHVQIGYPAKILAEEVHFQIERGMKLGVIGANGVGKSTLLKTVAGKIDALGGKMSFGHNVALSYFAQDQEDTLDGESEVLQNLLSINKDLGEMDARRLLGSFLFRGDDVFKLVKVLSGGEKSRVGLASALAKNANLLLLDEPTNHLDMLSVDVLSRALGDYAGSLLFVSHDRHFIDSVCTHILAILPDGRSQVFEGKIEDYVRLSKLSNFPNVLEVDGHSDKSKTASKVTLKQTDKKLTKNKADQQTHKNNQRKRQKLERQLESFKVKLVDVDSRLEKTKSTDYRALAELEEEKQLISQEIEQAEEEWLSLH